MTTFANMSLSQMQQFADSISAKIAECKKSSTIQDVIDLLQQTVDSLDFSCSKNSVPAASKKLFEALFVRLNCELGRLLFHVEEVERAQKCFCQALEVEPAHVNTLYNQGELFLAEQQFRDAVDNFDKILKISPNHAGAIYKLGLTHSMLGDPDKALPLFQRCAELNPDFPGANYWAGECLLYQSKYAEALPFFSKAHTLAPAEEDCTRGLAICFLALGKSHEAIALCDSLLTNSAELMALQIRGDACLQLGNIEEGALNHLDVAKQDFDAREFLVKKARLLHAKDPVLAERYAGVILEEFPDMAPSFSFLAQ